MKQKINITTPQKIKTFGNSMYPLLQDSDIVYLKRIKFPKIKVNDIVTIRKFGKFLTHRIIYKKNNYLITKGDNNLTSDGKIYPQQVVGKVYQVKRGNRIFNPEDLYLIQSSLYFAEIVKIKKALEKEKIEFVFLKGLPLHLYYEGSHPRRIYADCDVLIDQNDFEKVDKIMNSSGYTKIDNSISPLHRKFKKTINEINYIKYVNKYPIIFDIHLKAFVLISQMDNLNEIYENFLIDNMSRDFLSDKQILMINNEKFPALSKSNLIIFLCLHFLSHNFRGAYRLELLDKVIRTCHAELVSASNRSRNKFGMTTWKNIADIVTEYKLQNFVYPVFLLLKKLYKTPIPQNFLSAIQPSKFHLQYLSSIIKHPSSIFDDEPRIKAGITRFKNLFFLSPNPWWRKILVFTNLAVLYSIFWVFWRKIR